ncbi:hypothetical protein GCM10027168_10320 [Streptomyces capparidis]
MALNIGLGVVFALGIVFTACMLAVSWGGASWAFGSAVSVVVGGLALARERCRAPAAVAGLAVSAVAVTVSVVAGDRLPQEPAPVTALALSVLVGSAIRGLPRASAAGIAAGGAVVTGVTWLEGWTGVTGLATMGMAAALVAGPVLRGLDRDRRPDAPAPRASRAGLPRS